MSKIKKNITQYATIPDNKTYQDLYDIFLNYNKTKNYIYSRFSGINSFHLLNDYKKQIRDVFTHNGLLESWNTPKRYSRMAIDDAIANIKSMWSNTFNYTRKNITNNENLPKEEKHLLYYILKAKNLIPHLFAYDFQTLIKNLPNKFDNINDKIKIFKLLLRLIRKNKPNISKAKKHTLSMDCEMYNYEGDYIYLMCKEKRNRIKLKVNNPNRFTGNIIIQLINGKSLKINKAIDSKVKSNNNTENVVGIDKNFINALDSSSGNSYGKGLNVLQKNYTNFVKEERKRRNPVYEIYNKSKEEGDFKKTERIKLNNLGNIKHNRKKNKYKEEIRKCINSGIREMIEVEKPTLVVKEDLSFVARKKANRSKVVNGYMSMWVKGYIDERLEYKCTKEGIIVKDINAAYTSQICSCCGILGKRKGDKFYCVDEECSQYGGVESGINAAVNIRGRYYDKRISLDSSIGSVYKLIKKERFVDNNVYFNMDYNRANQDQIE